jgi:hypothetical protein
MRICLGIYSVDDIDACMVLVRAIEFDNLHSEFERR